MVTQLPWIYRAVMLYLAVMTLAGFLSMGWDKLMAKKGRWRMTHAADKKGKSAPTRRQLPAL